MIKPEVYLVLDIVYHISAFISIALKSNDQN